MHTPWPLGNNIRYVRIGIHYHLNIQGVEAFSVNVVLLMLYRGLDANVSAVNSTHNSGKTTLSDEGLLYTVCFLASWEPVESTVPGLPALL